MDADQPADLIGVERDLALALAATDDLETALGHVLEHACRFAGVDSGGVYVVETASGTLRLLAHRGLSPVFVAATSSYALDAPQVEPLRRGQTIHGRYPRLKVDERPGQASEGLQALVVVPIRHAGELVAALNVASHDRDELPASTRQAIETVAALVGDTLARIRALHELRASQRNLQALFDTVDDFFFILDEQGHILETNPSARERLGFSAEELRGRHVVEIHPPERRDEAGRIVAAMLEGLSSACPVPLLTRDGRLVPVETKVSRGLWAGRRVLFGVSRDVSERVRAEKALHDSEARWQYAIEGAGDGLWDWDVVTGRVDYSRQWKAMLGFEEDEIGGSLAEWDSRVHPDDRQRVYQALEQHLAGATSSYVSEHRVRCKDGSYKWILDRGQVIARAADGKPQRVIGTHSDVTARRLSEDLLRVQRDLSRALTLARTIPKAAEQLLAACLGIPGIDSGALYLVRPSDGGLELAAHRGLSEAFVALVGSYPPDAAQARLVRAGNPVYRSGEDLFGGDDARRHEGLRSLLSIPIRHEQESVACLNLASHSQEQVGEWTRQGVETIAELAGSVLARLRAETALRESEERYRTLVNASPSGVFLIREERVVFANRAAAALLGHETPDALVGLSVLELVPDRERDPLREQIAHAPVAEAGKPVEISLLRRDGSTVLTETVAAGVRFAGQSGTVVVSSDITERKRAAEALANTQRLESLGVLAGGLAHDFNNLLTGLFGYLDMARTACERERPADAQRRLDKAQAVYERARHLTQQLLTFAKGGAPVKKVAPLGPLLAQAAPFALSGSNVTLELDLAPELWPCRVDLNQIGQVIDNVVLNARQAMPGGGPLKIVARNVETPASLPAHLPAGRYLQLSFVDRGVGIAPETLPRVFDPFFSTKASGSGLGLATAYSIVRRHDGWIEVRSQPGEGTTVDVYLPAAGEQPILEGSAPVVLPGRIGRVLVMDDELPLREVLSVLLSEMGIEVEACADADEAVALFGKAIARGQPFSVAILDLTIPGGRGGIAVVAELRALGASFKAVATSGYSEDPVFADPGRFGFDAVLAKPFRWDDLAGVLARLGSSVLASIG
jgi:PAS domain S-box-containing protein